jgi:hypothetical protein
MFLYGPADTHFGHVDKWLDRVSGKMGKWDNGLPATWLKAKDHSRFGHFCLP